MISKMSPERSAILKRIKANAREHDKLNRALAKLDKESNRLINKFFTLGSREFMRVQAKMRSRDSR